MEALNCHPSINFNITSSGLSPSPITLAAKTSSTSKESLLDIFFCISIINIIYI
jgi:hypothetical protein